MRRAILTVGLAALAVPLLAQDNATIVMGTPDPARVRAGTYTVDGDHTQVAWAVNHLGISLYHGLFGNVAGTLKLDPANPSAASLNITIPLAKVETTSDALEDHLRKPDFFETAKYPTATFTSTKVIVQGQQATIAGDLRLHGVTKPVVLKARFTGAGPHPMNKKLNVGFEAETAINRSEWGIGYGVPMVSDRVDLRITAAFELQG